MLRLSLVSAAILFAAASAGPAGAQERDFVYFGWGHVRDSNVSYVTATCTGAPQFDRTNAQNRFIRALSAKGVRLVQLSNWTVGMPNDMQIEEYEVCMDARRDFINRERARGRQVEEISW